MKKLVFIFCCVFSAAACSYGVTWETIAMSAVKHNNSLESARRSLYASQAKARASFGRLLPQVSVGASGSRSGSEIPDTPPGALALSRSDSYSVSARASLLLFDGLATPNNVIAAFENANAAAYSFNDQSAAIRYTVMSDYINVIKNRSMVSVTQGIAERRKVQMEAVKLRYDGGRENIGSVLSAQADYQQAMAESESAKRQLAFSIAELNRSSGLNLDESSVIEGSLDVEDLKVNTIDAKSMALSTNSYLGSQCRRREAEASYRAVIGSTLPDVSLSASAGRGGSDWPPENRSWSLGLSASFDVFTGGATLGNIQSAGESLEAAKADERDALNTAVSDLDSAYNALLSAKDNADVSDKALEAAEKRAMIADAQYSNGLITYDTWSVIQDNLVNSRKNNIQSKANLLLADAALKKAEGMVLDEK